jgi:hypothetical protein
MAQAARLEHHTLRPLFANEPLSLLEIYRDQYHKANLGIPTATSRRKELNILKLGGNLCRINQSPPKPEAKFAFG